MPQAVRLIFALLFLALPLSAQQLELRFLDVGQGDAILIREGGKTALVDAGHSAARILPYLAALHVEAIDLLVATHNHADHIGGMPAVLGGVAVRFYLDNGVGHETATYIGTINAVKRSGATYLSATDRTLGLGDARLRVLPPAIRRGQNDSSVGLIGHMQVVKVAHHGARNGTIPELVSTTRPEVAVISVGATNAYGHPSPEVIEQWTRAGARIHRTDQEGTILVLAQRDGSFRVGAEDFAGATATGPQLPALDTGVATRASRSLAGCCKVCSAGKACGNSCISRSYTCHRPPGCACDASP